MIKTLILSTILLGLSGISTFAKSSHKDIPAGEFSFHETMEVKKEKTPEEKNLATRAEFEEQPLTEVIYEAKGKSKAYVRTIKGLDWGDPIQEDFATNIVFGDNNEVYFYNAIGRTNSMGYGSYVKGELKDGKIIVPVPQTLVAYDGGVWGRNFSLMEKVDNGEYEVSDIPYVTYDYDSETGIIKSELPGEDEEYILAITYSFDSTWSYIGDFSQVYTPYDDNFVEIPDGVELEVYYINDGNYGYPVEVGINGNNLYIKGMSLYISNGVVKGEIDGDTAYIPQDELIGTVLGNFIWTKIILFDPVTELALAPENDKYALSIDLENKIIKSADPEPIFAFNCALDRVFYYDFFWNFSLLMQTDFAGTPVNPNGLGFDGDDFRDFYGLYGFHFNISNISTDGRVLDPGYLYYSIFIDGDILEFEEIEGMYGYLYPYIEGIQTRIPFDFSNSYDIDFESQTGRFIGIYPDGLTTIGVQAIYEYEGVTTFSDIITLNVETNEITTEPAAVNSINNDKKVPQGIYNLQGLKVNSENLKKGLYIINGKKVMINK